MKILINATPFSCRLTTDHRLMEQMMQDDLFSLADESAV